jgi:hypothetical protein
LQPVFPESKIFQEAVCGPVKSVVSPLPFYLGAESSPESIKETDYFMTRLRDAFFSLLSFCFYNPTGTIKASAINFVHVSCL